MIVNRNGPPIDCAREPQYGFEWTREIRRACFDGLH